MKGKGNFTIRNFIVYNVILIKSRILKLKGIVVRMEDGQHALKNLSDRSKSE